MLYKFIALKGGRKIWQKNVSYCRYISLFDKNISKQLGDVTLQLAYGNIIYKDMSKEKENYISSANKLKTNLPEIDDCEDIFENLLSTKVMLPNESGVG